MNQINLESNIVEIETNEIAAAGARQVDEAITELNSTQLALIGGGCGQVSFD